MTPLLYDGPEFHLKIPPIRRSKVPDYVIVTCPPVFEVLDEAIIVQEIYDPVTRRSQIFAGDRVRFQPSQLGGFDLRGADPKALDYFHNLRHTAISLCSPGPAHSVLAV
jgi:hypothetical protein